jgi:hypothetical protein
MTKSPLSVASDPSEKRIVQEVAEVLALLLEEQRSLRTEMETLRQEVVELKVAHYVAMELILIHGSGLSPEEAHEAMVELFADKEEGE